MDVFQEAIRSWGEWTCASTFSQGRRSDGVVAVGAYP